MSRNASTEAQGSWGSSEAKLQPAIRDMVHRDRLLGQQRRVTERVAAHQDADSDPLGPRRQGGQQRPGFEVRAGWPTWLDEVVAVPDAVEPEPLEQLPAREQL